MSDPLTANGRVVMRILTDSECADWCSQHDFPARLLKGYIHGPNAEAWSVFHSADFRFPVDSGKKVWLARYLYSHLDANPELLICLGDWDVWPSSQHLPLFTRFREAFGEQRPLIEASGHVVTPEEADDAISIIALSLLFFWNCHILSASRRDAAFVSHDEFGWFASRDESITDSVRMELAAALSGTVNAEPEQQR